MSSSQSSVAKIISLNWTGFQRMSLHFDVLRNRKNFKLRVFPLKTRVFVRAVRFIHRCYLFHTPETEDNYFLLEVVFPHPSQPDPNNHLRTQILVFFLWNKPSGKYQCNLENISLDCLFPRCSWLFWADFLLPQKCFSGRISAETPSL